jgi:prevent-host-death family protein
LNESNDSFKIAEQVDWKAIMQTFTANEAKTRFGELINRVQREPIRVTRHNRVIGVMVSAEDYDAMRAFYADRLRHTLQQSASDAAALGLTQDQLEALLADES